MSRVALNDASMGGSGAAKIVPVVLCGGLGTRLWPLSRQAYPKQFLRLTGERSLLQETMARVNDPALFYAPLVVANAEHRFLVAAQCSEADVAPGAILLEPVSRNTAAAALAAALHVLRSDPNAVLALLPADHAIADAAGLRRVLSQALPAAQAGNLVTFGIAPQHPETGYGYIRHGEVLDGLDPVRRVAAFVEKPDSATAQTYVDDGRYLWNSGMFLLRADRLVEELEAHAPATVAAVSRAVDRMASDPDFDRLDAAALETAPSISLDHAVMEKTTRAAVLPCDIGWSDLGAWQTLWEQTDRDDHGNALLGPVRVRDVEDSYMRSEDGQLVAAVGLRDMVVVACRDAVLVVPRARAAEVGPLVAALKAEARREVHQLSVVHRPWGSYQDLAEGEGFRVKRIVVVPGGRLSLQYHKHRSEHWVVVSGTATVTRGRKCVEIGPNESLYIPVGVNHRLENYEREPLIMIEVQCGSYIGEDDIVRVEDIYGRPEFETATR